MPLYPSYINPVTVFSVKDHGATGNGTTDDTAAVQAAIDAAEAANTRGATVWFPAGVYKCNALTCNKPLHILGAGIGDDSTNASTSGTNLTQILWGEAGAGTMLDIISTTANAYLHNGSIRNILFKGNNLATYGVKGHSLSGWYIDISVRQVVTTGLLLDDSNGVLSQFCRIWLVFVYGSVAAVEGANGFEAKSATGAAAGATQCHVYSIFGLYKNGDMVKLGDSDNFIFEKIQATVISGGTGYSVSFRNSAFGATHARNHLIKYMVGKVLAESSTRGNNILHYISETGGITINAGGQLHFNAVDNINAERWTTPAFTMYDELQVLPGGMIPDGTVCVFGTIASLWGVINFPSTADGFANATVPHPFAWNDGTITGLNVRFSMDAANTSKNVRIQIRLITVSTGASPAAAEHNETFTIAVPDTQYLTMFTTLTLSTPLAFLRGQTVLVRIDRLAVSDAVDDATGNMCWYGFYLQYSGEGPDSAGSGTYNVPPTGV